MPGVTSASPRALCASQDEVIARAKNHILTSQYHWKKVTKSEVDEAFKLLETMVEFDPDVPPQPFVMHTA